MQIAPYIDNPFAQKYTKKYQEWWNNYSDAFVNTHILLKKQNHSLLQRHTINNDVIPYLEISALYRKANNGLLILNCNPSGTDVSYYTAHPEKNNGDVFFYDKMNKNSYFKAAEDISYKVGVGDNYAMIDLFPIVKQQQAVLREAYDKRAQYGLEKAFEELLDIFREAVFDIAPKVIICANAFVTGLIANGTIDSAFSYDNNGIFYNINCNGHKTVVFGGGMIAGGNQMDKESKKRLFRDVNNYRIQHP